jgi:hypothetical protein
LRAQSIHANLSCLHVIFTATLVVLYCPFYSIQNKCGVNLFSEFFPRQSRALFRSGAESQIPSSQAEITPKHSYQRRRKSPPWEHISYQSAPCGSRVSQTNTRQGEKISLASSSLQYRRRSIHMTANTNLLASLTRASTFYNGYMTGLMEQMDKICGASFG